MTEGNFIVAVRVRPLLDKEVSENSANSALQQVIGHPHSDFLLKEGGPKRLLQVVGEQTIIFGERFGIANRRILICRSFRQAE